jgi:hypothetical protein
MPQGSNSKRTNPSNNKANSAGAPGSNNSGSDGVRSNNSYYKPYGGWPGFMASYGLKPWDLDDVEEGRAILEALKAYDQEEQGGK